MKYLIAILLTFLFFSCNSNWEYKVIKFETSNYESSGREAFYCDVNQPSDSLLNVYGSQGWELIDTYVEIETAHPNFGNDEYVTGLQPNVRTGNVVLIFKRKTK
jgi:hypothetical protein